MRPKAGDARRGLKGLAVWLLLVSAAVAPGGAFTARMPASVPGIDGWEKIDGEAELQQPRVSVNYEFYVNPKRYGLYEIVRYRIRYQDPRGDKGYSSNEKLQWDAGNRTLRRYECRPRGPGEAGPCDWREMMRGSAEYDAEFPVILWLYGLHRRLLEERDAGRLPAR
jgi:hypothetical protein